LIAIASTGRPAAPSIMLDMCNVHFLVTRCVDRRAVANAAPPCRRDPETAAPSGRLTSARRADRRPAGGRRRQAERVATHPKRARELLRRHAGDPARESHRVCGRVTPAITRRQCFHRVGTRESGR